jgi:hypothetical protein
MNLPYLNHFIHNGITLLSPGGRFAIITFHSGEDRIVKQIFKSYAVEEKSSFDHQKTNYPTNNRSAKNVRARSAKLRIVEKYNYYMNLTFSNRKSKNTSHSTHRKMAVRTLSVCCAVFALSYVTLMVQTVSLVNERKEIREEIRTEQIKISDLETTYFTLAQSIDVPTLEKMGFTESGIPQFAYTQPTYSTVASAQ